MIERSERLRCPKCGQTQRVLYEEVNIEDWAAVWDEETKRYEYVVMDTHHSEMVDRPLGRCPDDGTEMEVLSEG